MSAQHRTLPWNLNNMSKRLIIITSFYPGKDRLHSGERAQNATQLESKARRHMRNLQDDRHKAKKFFKHPCVAYAA